MQAVQIGRAELGVLLEQSESLLESAARDQLLTSLADLERSVNMPYVTSAQRIGRAEGRQEGRQEGEVLLLRRLLMRRFGALPEWAEQRLAQATVEQVETWGDRVLEAASLTEVLGRPEG